MRSWDKEWERGGGGSVNELTISADYIFTEGWNKKMNGGRGYSAGPKREIEPTEILGKV